MNTSTFISHSEEETRHFAAKLAGSLKGGEKICLIGPLGAGKTTFVRGFVEAFQIPSSDVQSPTFTLVREYGSSPPIYHIDLYRLEKEDEIFEAGIYELLSGEHLVIVEWADKLKRYYPHPSIRIELSHSGETMREIYVVQDNSENSPDARNNENSPRRKPGVNKG